MSKCNERGVAINIVEYELDMAYFNVDEATSNRRTRSSWRGRTSSNATEFS
jgi:hypothetical protein